MLEMGAGGRGGREGLEAAVSARRMWLRITTKRGKMGARMSDRWCSAWPGFCPPADLESQRGFHQ